MKIIDCEQRSPEWYAARLNIPTASSFGKIITATGKERKGATPQSYMLALLGERLTRTPTIIKDSGPMARGRELEPMARRWYEETTGRTVRQIGFATDDSGRWGCSPDGLCDDRGVEIKCPMLPAFLAYATTGEIPDDHFIQMQACMWIFGVSLWDYVVYTDVRGLVPIVRTVEADPALMVVMHTAVSRFCESLDSAYGLMTSRGNGVPADTPLDLSALEREPTEAEINAMDQADAADI